MRKFGMIILILGIFCALFFGLKAKFLFETLKTNNDLIKKELNNNNNNAWLQFNWENLERYLIPIDEKWQKILSLMPFIKKEIDFQNNIKQIIAFNRDIQNGIFINNVLKNNQDNQEYLNKISQLLNFKNFFRNYHLDLIDKFFNDINYWFTLLGFNGEKNYLILYEVPSVSRPQGGLVTAYSILTLNKGIKAITFDSILSLDDLIMAKVVPPLPLQFVNNRWLFHDLNWFFDFPETAKKIMAWYNQTNVTPKIDGVITINTSVINDLMDLFNINPNLSLIDINNIFIKGLTDSMDYTNSKTNKEILLGLMNELIQNIQNQSPEKTILLQEQIIRNANNKDLEIYFNNDQLEYYFDNLNLTGKILSTPNDYLAVIFSNLSPVFKTNDVTKNISLITDFSTTTITNTLIIKEEKRPLNLESYLEIYLPANIQILETQGLYLKSLPNTINYKKFGFIEDSDIVKIEQNKIKNDNFEVYSENDKTIISGWAKPSINSVKIVYMLPFVSSDVNKWRLILQKQSGIKEVIKYNIVLPKNKKIKPTLFSFDKPFILNNDFEINYELEQND
ncbi:MAG: DUF4012 domain-containing protein [Minisyncoccia bacterium]